MIFFCNNYIFYTKNIFFTKNCLQNPKLNIIHLQMCYHQLVSTMQTQILWSSVSWSIFKDKHSSLILSMTKKRFEKLKKSDKLFPLGIESFIVTKISLCYRFRETFVHLQREIKVERFLLFGCCFLPFFGFFWN